VRLKPGRKSRSECHRRLYIEQGTAVWVRWFRFFASEARSSRYHRSEALGIQSVQLSVGTGVARASLAGASGTDLVSVSHEKALHARSPSHYDGIRQDHGGCHRQTLGRFCRASFPNQEGALFWPAVGAMMNASVRSTLAAS